jgi:hypothetical protein
VLCCAGGAVVCVCVCGDGKAYHTAAFQSTPQSLFASIRSLHCLVLLHNFLIKHPCTVGDHNSAVWMAMAANNRTDLKRT